MAGCPGASGQRGAGQDGDSSAKLKVVCTTAQIADLVRNEHVSVASLMGAGDDPHSYLPKPREAGLLNQADIVFYNGLHLEGRMADMLEKMSANRPVFAVTAELESKHAERLIATSEFYGHYDPHVWFDAELWTHVVDFVAATLGDQDPERREDYLAGAEKYKSELIDIDSYCKTQLAEIDEETRVLVTAHDAFGYFGRAYGLEVHGLQGLSSADEASLGRINELVELLVSRKIKAVFIESSVPPRHLQTVIDECRREGHEVKIGGELFSDAMGEEGSPEGTYLGMMRHNIETILAALN